MIDLVQKWASIGLERNYSGLNLEGLELDLDDGWGSEDPIFKQVVETFKPKLIIEVGTWKGASLVHMARLAEQQGVDTQFICIDTWLGSNDSLWLREKYRKSLMLENGYPTMYRQFIHNIQKKGIADRVFPLPMTSSSAYHLLKQLEIRPEAVYIDAGHEEEEVKLDLEYYYDLLKPNGVLFGDDYSFYWSGVVAAVNKFAAKHELPLWANPEKLTGKFMIQKPNKTKLTKY